MGNPSLFESYLRYSIEHLTEMKNSIKVWKYENYFGEKNWTSDFQNCRTLFQKTTQRVAYMFAELCNGSHARPPSGCREARLRAVIQVLANVYMWVSPSATCVTETRGREKPKTRSLNPFPDELGVLQWALLRILDLVVLFGIFFRWSSASRVVRIFQDFRSIFFKFENSKIKKFPSKFFANLNHPRRGRPPKKGWKYSKIVLKLDDVDRKFVKFENPKIVQFPCK